jgi:sigma-E factor negative regulatory protein RseA
MVMNEKISRLMDGELDGPELQSALAALKNGDAHRTWACYHVIGDVLRGDATARSFACGLTPALAAQLAAEPTVLAPRRSGVEKTATWGWAAAATIAAAGVVGWTAFSLVDDTPAAMAKAREAGSVRAAQVRPAATVPSDYVVAHQEFSPTGSLQAVGPYLRAAAIQSGDVRP